MVDVERLPPVCQDLLFLLSLRLLPRSPLSILLDRRINPSGCVERIQGRKYQRGHKVWNSDPTSYSFKCKHTHTHNDRSENSVNSFHVYLCVMTDPLLDATVLLSHVSQSLLLLGTLILPLSCVLQLPPLLFFLRYRLYKTVTGGRDAPPVRLVSPTAQPMLTAKSVA